PALDYRYHASAGIGLKVVRSGFLPFRQGHELVHDFLQSLQSPFLIGGSDHFLATLQVQAVGFTDLCDFFSQLSHALFDGLWHRDRLAELFTPWQSCFPTVLTVPVLAASLGNRGGSRLPPGGRFYPIPRSFCAGHASVPTLDTHQNTF